MRRPVILITGAAGEIGQALIERLSTEHRAAVVTIDLRPLDADVKKRTARSFTGSVLDRDLLDSVLAEFAVDRIYHLAALLSTRSEFTPLTAHNVNVEGTLNLLEFAQAQGRSHGRPVIFFYPSSIAAYGVDPACKDRIDPVRENSWAQPITMYGCNKLYCELLGSYYSNHYRQLDAVPQVGRVDFRSLRFPGLISAETMPSGGTSDYAPEMLHAAAKSGKYTCFVRPQTKIPFMTMPDAIDAVLALTDVAHEKLSQTVYNVGAFHPTAEELAALVRSAFPDSEVMFAPDAKRQQIIDTWPATVDDSAARSDWSFEPRHILSSAFEDYLIPAIKRRYALI